MKNVLSLVLAAALLQAISAHAQTDSTKPLPKVTTKVLGTPVDIGAKPPAGNPGKNVTISPDTFTRPATKNTPADTALGVTVTVPLGNDTKKK